MTDSFYQPSHPLPSEPGALIRSEPYEGDMPNGLVAWRILYSTTDLEGTPVVASAVLACPLAPDKPAHLVAWAHGTVGVAQECAPSLTRSAISETAVPALSAVLRNGWALVAPDYPGMGTAGNTPFLVGQGEGRSVLDGIRAARRLTDLNLSPRTAIWGHSQGGHAALWSTQISPVYAPELDIVGTAALAPATDLPSLAVDIAARGGMAAIVLSYLVVAYSLAYPDVDLDALVPTARDRVLDIVSRCPPTEARGVDPVDAAALMTTLAELEGQTVFDFDFTGGAFLDRLTENVPRGPFPNPVFIAWGKDDEVIPARIQDGYVASLGSSPGLSHRSYPGTHVSVLTRSTLPHDLERWTKDRFG